MAKYIVQHRRGTATQWAEQNTIIPMEGELVIEIDEENSLHKLKIGDGIHTYAELAYLQAGDEIVTQVIAEVKPRIVTIMLSETWNQDVDGKYSQIIPLENITEHSRLDLQPDVDMLAEFKSLNLIFTTENHNGVITVYSVGDVPLKSYTMQATIVETEADCEKIVGTPVGAPAAKPDWAQTDVTKADYIKNKPTLVGQTTPHGGEIFNDYENNKALADFTTAHGTNNIAGYCGYTIVGATYDGEVYDPSVTDTMPATIKDGFSEVVITLNDAPPTDTNPYYFDSVTGDEIAQYILCMPKGASGELLEITPATLQAGVNFNINYRLQKTHSRAIFAIGMTEPGDVSSAAATIVFDHSWVKLYLNNMVQESATIATGLDSTGEHAVAVKGVSITPTGNANEYTVSFTISYPSGTYTLSGRCDMVGSYVAMGFYNGTGVDLKASSISGATVTWSTDYTKLFTNGKKLFWKANSGYPSNMKSTGGYFNVFENKCYIPNKNSNDVATSDDFSVEYDSELNHIRLINKTDKTVWYDTSRGYNIVPMSGAFAWWTVSLTNDVIKSVDGSGNSPLMQSYLVDEFYEYLNAKFDFYIQSESLEPKIQKKLLSLPASTDDIEGFLPRSIWSGHLQFGRSTRKTLDVDKSTIWAVGDALNLVADYKPIRRFVITAISDNQITISDTNEENFLYHGALGDTSPILFYYGSGAGDECYITNAIKPLIGEPIPYYANALVAGENIIGTGRSILACGRNNYPQGDYGITSGRNNVGGYCGLNYGQYCDNIGEFSIAGGYNAKANRLLTTSMGLYTDAYEDHMTVFGVANKTDLNGHGGVLLAIGNGTVVPNVGKPGVAITRSNALTIYKDGTVSVGDDKVVATEEYVDNAIKNSEIVDIDQTYNPESENPQSGKAVAEALASAGGGGDCVVYLDKDTANYETIKAELDSGKEVIIVDSGGSHYYCQYDDGESIGFETRGTSYYMGIEYFTDSAYPYEGNLIREAEVQHEYDANSDNPISGIGVAKALETVGGDCVVYLTKEEADYNTIKSYIDAGKEVVIINEESSLRYYLKKYDGTYFIFSGDILGEFFSLIYRNTEEEPEESYAEYLTEYSIENYVDNYYNPTGSSPISGTGVAEALSSIGDSGVIYLSKEEVNYELLKGHIDAGKEVIIYDGACYYYLSSCEGDNFCFVSNTASDVYYLDYYPDFVDEGRDTFIADSRVECEYNPNNNYNPISGAGVAEALKYKKLYDTVTITSADIETAGEKGITAITIGSNDVSLAEYDDILIRIYIPKSDTLNDGQKGLAVLMTENGGFSMGDYNKLLYAQSSSLSPACFINHDRYNLFAVNGVWTGNKFLFGQVMKNGYSTSYGYAGVQNAWTSVADTLDKNSTKYFHIYTANGDFKFPENTYVEVYAK